MWIFSTEPKGKSYEELIDFAASLCNEFMLVRRKKDNASENVKNLLKDLNEFIIEEKKQQSWHGTRIGGYALVYYFKLNDITKEIIKKYSEGLYSWIEPLLLQDLCFLKENREPWIINTAHEKFSFISNCSNDEIDKLTSISGIELEEI